MLHLDIHSQTNSYPVKKHKPNHHHNETTPCLAGPRQSFWNPRCNCLFSCFPDELMIFAIFFPFLNASELCACVAVCRRWKFLATDKLLWRRLILAKHSKITDSYAFDLFRRFGPAVFELELCECKKLSKSVLLQIPSFLKNLESLHLCQLKVVDDIVVASIAHKCQRLESLALFGCDNVTDKAIEILGAKRTNLRQLSLGNCIRLTNEALVNLGSESLRDLNLRGCRRITAEGVLGITRRSPFLEKVNFHGIAVTDEFIQQLISDCRQLKEINLASANPFGGSLLTDLSLGALSQLGSYLVSLNLQGSSRLTDDAIVQFARKCTKLEKINLGGCSRLGNKAAAALSHFCSDITHLSLFQSSTISDIGVTLLLSKLKKLTLLDLHSCMGLTNLSLSSIPSKERGQSLKFLDLGSCRGISEDCVNQIRLSRSDLKITYY